MIGEPDVTALLRGFRKVDCDDPALLGVATLLACFGIVRPSQRRKKRKQSGRPKNLRAIWVAGAAIGAVEALCRCRIDLPKNDLRNDKPRGIETLVREIFAALIIEGHAKAAIRAALIEREHAKKNGGKVCLFPNRRGIDAETFFARRNDNVLFDNAGIGGPTIAHDRADHRERAEHV